MTIAISKESDVSPLGIVVGVVVSIASGGIAYMYSLSFITKSITKHQILEREQKQLFSDKDLLVANSFLLMITLLLSSILVLAWLTLGKNLPYIGVVFIVIYLVLFPAFVGSLFYLVSSAFIILLDKIGKTQKGALWPIALALFILGGVILLIDAW